MAGGKKKKGKQPSNFMLKNQLADAKDTIKRLTNENIELKDERDELKKELKEVNKNATK